METSNLLSGLLCARHLIHITSQFWQLPPGRIIIHILLMGDSGRLSLSDVLKVAGTVAGRDRTFAKWGKDENQALALSVMLVLSGSLPSSLTPPPPASTLGFWV